MANKSLPNTNGSVVNSSLSGVDGSTISAEEFKKSFGEDLSQTLDVSTWRMGEDITKEVDRIEIRWPSGIHQVLRNVKTNQVLKVRESAKP